MTWREDFVKWFVLFIILVKIVYSIAYYGHHLISNTSTELTEKYDKTILYWKHVTEFIFIVCMSVLLIYHFYPEKGFLQKPIVVDKETRFLFLLYGTILIFTADWTVFFDEESHFVRVMNKIK